MLASRQIQPTDGASKALIAASPRGAVVTIETINAAGLRVEVTLRDTGSKMRADVFIENHRGDRVEVRPEQFRLAITDPSYKELKYNDPDRLARSIQRRAAWSGGLVALGGTCRHGLQRPRPRNQGRLRQTTAPSASPPVHTTARALLPRPRLTG